MKVLSIPYLGLLLVCFNSTFSQGPQKALSNYLAVKDSVYKWKAENVITNEDGRFYELLLTTQRWHGIDWKHRLIVYFPKKKQSIRTH